MKNKGKGKELKKLIIAVRGEKQFNKKVEKNKLLINFIKSNNIYIKNESNLTCKYFFGEKLILKTTPVYSSRRTNLEYKRLNDKIEVI